MKLIPLISRKYKYSAKVDDEDYDWLNQYRWNVTFGSNGKPYAHRAEARNGKRVWISMHREINETPEDLLTDHEDLDTLNNQRYNLRTATHAQNHMNTRPRVKHDLKGITFLGSYSPKKPWQARITINGTCTNLGCFVTEDEAARVYDDAALKHFGEFANPNF